MISDNGVNDGLDVAVSYQLALRKDSLDSALFDRKSNRIYAY